jgi:hypothetical protein
MENDMTDDDALIARLRDAIGIRRDGTLILTDEHVRTMREAADRLEVRVAERDEARHQLDLRCVGNIVLREERDAARAELAALRAARTSESR